MSNRLRLMSRLPLALLFAGVGMQAPEPVRAADHLDSPRVRTALGLDINDVYVFRSATRNNTVIAVTVSPVAGVVGPTTFEPVTTGGLYEIKVDNNGDRFEDITFTIGFSAPNANGVQSVVVLETRNGLPVVIASGTTGRDLRVTGSGTFRADIFDDPFFFDLNHTNEFFRRVDNNLPNPVGPFLPMDPGTTDRPPVNPNVPNSFFAGHNTLAVVLDIPSSRLQQSRTNTSFGVWARTIRNGEQFDRMAIPAINTAIIPRLPVVPGVILKDAFNSVVPSQDRFFFRDIAINEVTRVFRFGNPAGVADLVDLLLPDILPYNTASSTGFPNGRRLADDVIDVEFDLLTDGALTSDRVNNDSYFRSKFPYLGIPNPPPTLQ